MTEALRDLVGEQLTLDEYLADFRARFWRTDASGGWKLERRQTFREPGNPSWEAMTEGDWEQAMSLLREGREDVRKYQEKIRAHGFQFRRVRIVDTPYSQYLRWELNSLIIRHQCGDRIRTLPAEEVRDLERGHPLPEIVVLGGNAVYQVSYDHTGLPVGAVRSMNQHAVRDWIDLIRALYERGENLPDFFAREIAHLQPTRSG
jgi:hypothetical protein